MKREKIQLLSLRENRENIQWNRASFKVKNIKLNSDWKIVPQSTNLHFTHAERSSTQTLVGEKGRNSIRSIHCWIVQCLSRFVINSEFLPTTVYSYTVKASTIWTILSWFRWREARICCRPQNMSTVYPHWLSDLGQTQFLNEAFNPTCQFHFHLQSFEQWPPCQLKLLFLSGYISNLIV